MGVCLYIYSVLLKSMSCYFLSGDSTKIANCEFCGENFKKTQSLASHARSHLRQLGVTDWTAHGSPMATLRELMARRSCSSLPQSTQTTPLTPAQAKPRPEVLPTSAQGPTPVRVPKARKGSRMVVSKPKNEPVELDISQQSTNTKNTPPIQLNLTTVQSDADYTTLPANQNLTAGKC